MKPDRSQLPPRGDPANLNYWWSRLILTELQRCGIECFCVSPGSRSAPLAVEAAYMKGCHVHFDERGAAFFALGRAKATGRPSVLICTSGTAAANYFPAVIEASMSCVPLIVLTADRPPELLDAGANQAIDQTKLYGGYVRWQTVMPCPDEHIPWQYVLTTIDQATYRATQPPAGPVHVNCMFREPLAPVSPEGWKPPLWLRPPCPFTSYVPPSRALTPSDVSGLVNLFDRTEGVLIVGQLASESEASAVSKFARNLNWPVFPDILSGLRLIPGDPPMVPYYDQILLDPAFTERLRDVILLHVGGSFVSKRLLQAIESRSKGGYIRLASHPFRHDPAHRVTARYEADIAASCSLLAKYLKPVEETAFTRAWFDANKKVDQTIQEFLASEDALSEIAIARLVSENVEHLHVLFLGNSMPIRDMDMYAAPSGQLARVAANRGASGIDGTIATAAGFAHEWPLTVVLGDLALLHDLNSLTLLKESCPGAIVVVINNDGGGIFSFLPIAQCGNYWKQYFAAPHGLRFEHAAAGFGFAYAAPQTVSGFTEAYSDAVRSREATVIEIACDREQNLHLHRLLQERIQAAVGDVTGH